MCESDHGRAEAVRGVCARALFTGVLLVLAACHDPSGVGGQRYSIEGTLSGLNNGQMVELEVNGASPLELTTDGVFEFPNAVAGNGSYDVTVAAQPMGQVCTVSNATGSGVTRQVTNLVVACSATTYTIGGQVSGLPTGTQVVLENNGADALTVSSNGGFTFTIPVAFDGSYNVTVSQQPSYATCSVSAGSSAGVTANVSGVSVVCSVNSFPVGGTLSGLGVGVQVTLQDNGADPLTLSADGAFTFPIQVAADGSYNVTVGTQPAGQTCTVSNGQGTNIDSDISDVSVSCSASSYTIGGTVTGLASGAQVTLEDNGADPLTVTVNGSFTFSAPVAYGSSYDVTVSTEPTEQSCAIATGSGANVAANVADVQVTCLTTDFATPGSYSFTVPDGVTSLQIVAIGGGGGGGGASGTFYAGTKGGDGASVSSTLAVTPGQVLNLVVGAGGGAGESGPGSGGSYTCGAGGGGGGASSVDAGNADQLVAGGGGGGGSCVTSGDGGNGGGTNGTGGQGGLGNAMTAAAGGSGGIGGSGASAFGPSGPSGGDGNGGPGAAGGNNGPYTGGVGGSGVGTGSGGVPTSDAGGGGGGYGGGGAGADNSGGGAGGSVGASGTMYGPASNGGAAAAAGGNGSIVIALN